MGRAHCAEHPKDSPLLYSLQALVPPPAFRRTERQAHRLDSVARDNLADSLMPQVRRAGRTLTQLGPGSRDWEPDYTGRSPASDRWPNLSWTPFTRRDDNVRGARPLSASQTGFGLPAGRPRFMPGRGPRRPLSRPYHGGRRLGWEPQGRSAYPAALSTRARRHQWTSRQGRPPAAPQLPRARPAPPRAQKVRPSLGPGIHARGPGMASTTPGMASTTPRPPR